MKRAELPSFGNLNGIRVVTTGTNIAGPVAATFLAEQGAEVIHIESTKAPDMLRRMGRAWTMEHRNGRSMALNIPDPEGKKIFLKLLEEAVLEEKGEKPVNRASSTADLAISANIPESYVASSEQRMDLYRRIALIRTESDADDVLDELIDRYGEPPQPVLKLMDVALLRAEAVQIGVSDISQRGSEITFTFAASEAVPVEAVMALCSLPKNRRRLTLSATGTEPKLLLRLTPNEDALDTALTLVGDLRVNKEENEKEVTL